jgi:PhnB protein
MTTRLNPYLGFKDTARQAMEFYQTVFGGELTLSTFGEMHASSDPAEQDLIMHSQLESPSGYTLMGSDTPSHMSYSPGDNYSVSLSGDDEAELRGYWDKLTDGATVAVPLEAAPWGAIFGMLTDRFGVNWLVNIGPQ